VKAWLVLAAAIACEVGGTIALRAVVDHVAWTPVVVLAYLASFVLLGATLRAGLPIGVVYGVWGAAGVALTAVFGALIYSEVLRPAGKAGIALIVVGVVLVQTGARPRAGTSA